MEIWVWGMGGIWYYEEVTGIGCMDCLSWRFREDSDDISVLFSLWGALME